MLCGVTHNSCSVVSLKERINDVLRTGATGAVKKKKKNTGVCVCFVSSVFFGASAGVHCLKPVCDSICSLVDCLRRYDEGWEMCPVVCASECARARIGVTVGHSYAPQPGRGVLVASDL